MNLFLFNFIFFIFFSDFFSLIFHNLSEIQSQGIYRKMQKKFHSLEYYSLEKDKKKEELDL